jgi:pilus assembly protein CpaF
MQSRSVIYALESLRPLERFLKDDSVTEIMVNGAAPVVVERQGERPAPTDVVLSPMQINTIVTQLSSLSRREVDLAGLGGRFVVSARLPGFRIEAQLPPVAVDGPYLSIRSHHRRALSLRDAVGQGLLDASLASALADAVRARANLLVVGGTGSGKTTFLNALIREIDIDERLLFIETVPELDAPHWNLVRLEADDDQGYPVQRLVKSALRSRPDRVLIGELRGGEAFDFIDAANTGHPGSMATVHANSAREGLERLENLLLEGRPNMPLAAIRRRIAQTLNVVVHLQRQCVGGRMVRRLTQALCVQGLCPERGEYLTQPLPPPAGQPDSSPAVSGAVPAPERRAPPPLPAPRLVA